MVLDPLRRELEQRSRIYGRTLANEWERDLKRTNPVDTGNMRDRTTVTDQPTGGGVRIEARVDTDYAEFVSEGTRPHQIVSKTKGGALRFTWHGKVVYFQSVMHPGTQPNPWWTDSIKRLPALSQRVWRAIR